MQPLYKSGRYFFAFAIIAFGFIQLNVQEFMTGFLPVSKTLPGRMVFLYIISIFFVLGGIGMCIDKTMRRAALLVGWLLLVLLIYPHLASLVTDLHNPMPWTASAEDLALCGGAFIIAGDVAAPAKSTASPDYFKIGRIAFAISLIVFAVQHFMYADYIAGLITAWIPFKLFLTYFIGVAFVLGCISILTEIKIRLACILLGFMFLFWVIFLHLPRVAADTHSEPEKTSMFIAFAFCGIFFTLAGHYPEKVMA
jgi:uncharacterized membrane protein